MLADFRNSFADKLTGKFATNSYLNISPHLKYIADHVRQFNVISFSLLQQLCTVDNGIFYMAGVNTIFCK